MNTANDTRATSDTVESDLGNALQLLALQRETHLVGWEQIHRIEALVASALGKVWGLRRLAAERSGDVTRARLLELL